MNNKLTPFILILALSLTACSTATPTPTPAPVVTAPDNVVAEGHLMPRADWVVNFAQRGRWPRCW